ncbi:FimV/HubP family polar landmark protein [Vibrio metoecus]|uniref:FimV/HubP family polar landmark protein n=1 Tax=Vibrio metoecus TaxID=1481663 RepID=UPI0012AD9F39|nr:FimV/HubP family polar landmark protein [Vibrio metoecus]
MRRFFQRLLLPVAVMVVTQISFVSAESIRLVGPNGQVQPTPQYSENIVRNSANSEPGKFFGPTTENQTLWSIATQLRPSPSVTVQQTLLAIYQLNPQAFENQNIHTLIPGSTLRVPSLAQISRNSNQEAVNIMAAHQAKLNQTPVAPAVPVRPAAPPKVQEVAQTQPEVAPQPKVEEKPAPEIKNAVKPVNSETEVMALEEKNHTLRVMLSEVQSEVSSLKQELGDENRIRSEVEKLLEEERRKAEEAQRLAPSSLDNLLSNGWLVALLALIPGLLIAIVVLLLLNRRSAAQQDNTNSSNLISEMPTAAPVTLGPEQTDDIGDDLLLDDDLFSTTDDKEESAQEDKAFSDDDVFADLNETDLDFNLDGQDSEDLFVGIDDDGDLDTEFDALNESANGISVNSDDKALGLEEMERALNDVTTETEDEDLNSFDLADEHQMSEDDIEALLSGDAGQDEPLEDGNIDQSLLDDLLSSELDALDEEPELQDTETLDTLLNDELDLLNTEGDDEFDLSGAGVVDEQDLDDLFASIEEQADLEHLEANAVDETALLDEMLAEHETPVAENSTDLLEELLDEFDTPETDELGLRATHLAQADEPLAELEQDSTQLLDEVLGEPISNEDLSGLDIDQNSTELLDELLDDLDLDDESVETSEFSVAPEKLSVEDGTELFDELLEIEQQAEQVDSPIDDEFNSDTFIDDLLNSAPATDPLLEPQRDELESIAQADDFDFKPEIEGSTEEESAPLPQNTLPANEFGIPQDDDWAFEEETSSHGADNLEAPSLSTSAINDLSDIADSHETKEEQQDEALTINDLVLPEETEEQAFSTFAQQDMTDVSELDMDPQPEPVTADANDTDQDIETSIIDDDLLDDFAPELSNEQAVSEQDLELSLDPEVEQEFVALDELELPEFTEEDALVEALQAPAESELEASLDPEVEQEFVALDDLELPEFTEEDALAEALQAPVEESELEVSPEPEAEEEFVALDELELPEFTEEEALAEALQAPIEEPELEVSPEPEAEDEFTALDELEQPEFTEEDALAEALPTPAESELEASLDPEVEQEFIALDELELPEFTEEDALAEALQAPVEEPELEVSPEPEAEDDFATLDELELPEFTEEESLAEALQAPVEEPELEVSPEPEAEDEFATLDELELPEFTEEDALAEALPTPEESELDASLDPEVEQEFVALDEQELPEFTEEDALAEALQAPIEEPELEVSPEPEAEEEFVALDELELPEFTEEDALAEALQAPVEESELEVSPEAETEDEFTALDELELPEFTEEDALAEALQAPVEEPELETSLDPEVEQEFIALDEQELPEFTEDDALAEVLQVPAEPELGTSLEPDVDQVPAAALEIASETPTETASRASQQGYDEDALHDWLSERPENEKTFSFDRPLDAKTIDSAGMDIDAMLQMGGEDWNGFHLTPDQQAQLPDDVPEDEQAIWASETPEPQAKPENWGSQEDLLDFDPQRDGYMTIDELMAQVESEEQNLNPDEEELKLDVGLDEFPDVIGDIRDIDVDSGAEAAGKLDLAKIYIEMNDEKGAIKLLEEAIVDGDDEIRQQAKRLIDVLNGRV